MGLAATASTTYAEPYHVARAFASLDHLSRIGARLVRWTDPDYPTNLRHIADHVLETGAIASAQPATGTDFAEPNASSRPYTHPKHTTAQPTQLERAGRTSPLERP